MDSILSEKELMPQGVSWGDWNFNLMDPQINERISSLPENLGESPDISDGHWLKLISLLPSKGKTEEPATADDSVVCLDEVADSPMESSPVTVGNLQPPKEPEDCNSSIEDITLCLVDACNQAAPKLKTGVSDVREEMISVINNIQNLSENLAALVMEESWSQLYSEAAKACFCIGFSCTPALCKVLCQKILLPWMSKSLPTKLEQFSEIFLCESEIVCRRLIAPLLLLEDSPLVDDLFSLEELMNSMDKRHWTLLLSELLSSQVALQSWSIPVLAMVMEHSEPTFDNVCAVVQLMSSTGTGFAQSRDFGSLLVAVANCLKPTYGSVISELKLIADSYKGSLKFKALKTLNDIKEP